MSATRGVIYIKLDVRGSKGQSSSDLYRLLGNVEVKDQIFVIKFVICVDRPGRFIQLQDRVKCLQKTAEYVQIFGQATNWRVGLGIRRLHRNYNDESAV